MAMDDALHRGQADSGPETRCPGEDVKHPKQLTGMFMSKRVHCRDEQDPFSLSVPHPELNLCLSWREVNFQASPSGSKQDAQENFVSAHTR